MRVGVSCSGILKRQTRLALLPEQAVWKIDLDTLIRSGEEEEEFLPDAHFSP